MNLKRLIKLAKKEQKETGTNIYQDWIDDAEKKLNKLEEMK